MSSPFQREPAPPGTLADLRSSVETELRALLGRFHIPERDAEELLERCLVEGLYKTESPHDFSRYVQVSLASRCLAYWKNRRLTPAIGASSCLCWGDESTESVELPSPQHPAGSGRLLRFLTTLRPARPA